MLVVEILASFERVSFLAMKGILSGLANTVNRYFIPLLSYLFIQVSLMRHNLG